MRRGVIAPLVALVLGLGGAVAVAAPAQAAASDCATAYVCLWTGYNHTGTIHRIPAQPRGTCYSVPNSFNDVTRSAYNRLLTRHVQFYQDAGCRGHRLHRQHDCWDGPFPAGSLVPAFLWDITGTCDNGHRFTNDVDKLTSVFFNTG